MNCGISRAFTGEVLRLLSRKPLTLTDKKFRIVKKALHYKLGSLNFKISSISGITPDKNKPFKTSCRVLHVLIDVFIFKAFGTYQIVKDTDTTHYKPNSCPVKMAEAENCMAIEAFHRGWRHNLILY